MADLGVINALSFGHWQVSIGSCCGRKARGGMLRHAPSAGYRGVDRGNQAPQVYQSRKTEGSQGAMCGPQGKHSAWTPERSNPDRELVKRKQSSDCGRHIRKRDR
jgi:hypothetical protein